MQALLIMLTLSLLMIMVAVLNIFAGTIPFDARSSTKKRSVKRDKIPLLVHIHKSGGTTMCQTAQKNGEAVNRDNNCNMKGDGPWTITEKSLSRTCEERYQLAKEERYSFVAMERFMLEDELDCKDRFTYILIVRDPEQRHESHIDVHRHGVFQEKHWGFVGRKKRVKTKKKWSKYHPMAGRRAARRRLKKRQVKSALGVSLMDNDISGDNYLTRILIGKKGFDGTLPIGSITDEHGEEAKKKLEQFDIILLLEKFEQHKVQLVSHLGWTEWIGVANARSKEGWNEEASSESGQDNGPTTFELNNFVDLALYKHAGALAEHLTAPEPARK